jgi:hypothetical protein
MTDFDPFDTFRATAVAPDEQRSTRIREEFRARIATMATDDDGRRPFDGPVVPPRPRITYRQPALAVVVLALILGLVGASAFWLQPDQGHNGSINALATNAGRQPDQTLDDGQYLYRRDRSRDPSAGAMVRDLWTARDGTGQVSTAAMQIDATGEETPSLTVLPTPGSLEFAGLSYDELRNLPTDPEALLTRLHELGVVPDAAPPGDQAAAVAEVLSLHVTPPAVAAAGVHALQRLGATTVGPIRVDAGRVGTGVRGHNDDGTAWIVVLDDRTGRAVAFAPNVEAGRPLTGGDSYRVWVDQRITDALPSS